MPSVISIGSLISELYRLKRSWLLSLCARRCRRGPEFEFLVTDALIGGLNVGGMDVANGISVGVQAQFFCVAILSARDGGCCEILNTGLSCFQGGRPIPRILEVPPRCRPA